MKIIEITPITPASQNIRGTSAIQYHLLVHRPKDVEVDIYSFNNNHLSDDQIKEVEQELNTKIHVISQPKWIDIVLKMHLLFVRVFLKYPIFNYIKLPQNIVDEIIGKQPDGIWIYGQDTSRITRQFPNVPRVHTLPDSEALYYYRMLGQRFVFTDWKQYLRNAIMYPKYTRMEHNYPVGKDIHYHLVGDADVQFLKNNNTAIDAHFLRHPHYDILEPQKQIKFSQPKIKLLIAGQYNLYMKQSADELVDAMCGEVAKQLSNHYAITILGKGWESAASRLQNSGYEVDNIKFADDYIEEIKKHDIQLTPIAIGTGTKGKVLDALANGLLVIGTYYALENIAVISGESCIEYRSAEDAINALLDIPTHLTIYEQMAELGRQAVLTEHNRAKASNALLSFFENKPK